MSLEEGAFPNPGYEDICKNCGHYNKNLEATDQNPCRVIEYSREQMRFESVSGKIICPIKDSQASIQQKPTVVIQK